MLWGVHRTRCASTRERRPQVPAGMGRMWQCTLLGCPQSLQHADHHVHLSRAHPAHQPVWSRLVDQATRAPPPPPTPTPGVQGYSVTLSSVSIRSSYDVLVNIYVGESAANNGMNNAQCAQVRRCARRGKRGLWGPMD